MCRTPPRVTPHSVEASPDRLSTHVPVAMSEPSNGSLLASPEGVEPPACSLGKSCSIRLSYGDMRWNAFLYGSALNRSMPLWFVGSRNNQTYRVVLYWRVTLKGNT